MLCLKRYVPRRALVCMVFIKGRPQLIKSDNIPWQLGGPANMESGQAWGGWMPSAMKIILRTPFALKAGSPTFNFDLFPKEVIV